MQEKDFGREIDILAEQVKTLALNLAISLARTKNENQELAFLEPEFTRLVNGSVEVVKEVSSILKAFRNEGHLVYSPKSESEKLDRVEHSLNEILNLSRQVLESINQIRGQQKKVDNHQ